jgi:hypothetical protein
LAVSTYSGGFDQFPAEKMASFFNYGGMINFLAETSCVLTKFSPNTFEIIT